LITTNKENLPQILVQAITNQGKKYSRGAADISVTQLIDAPLQRILKKQYWNEIVEDVSDKFWAFWGSMGHQILEEIEGSNIILKEERLFVTVDDWVISGQLDLYHIDYDGLLTLDDFKFPSVRAIQKGIKHEYEKQLNIYKYMLKENGKGKVEKMRVLALLRDASFRDPKAVAMTAKMYKHEKIHKYIQGRVAMHKLYASDLLANPPECTPKERWQDPEKYAIMKTGNVRQTGKDYDTIEEAERVCLSLIEAKPKEEFKVVTKPQVNKRCQGYCSVSKFCWWWNIAAEERPDTHSQGIEEWSDVWQEISGRV
jgi:hypothetical protein